MYHATDVRAVGVLHYGAMRRACVFYHARDNCDTAHSLKSRRSKHDPTYRETCRARSSGAALLCSILLYRTPHSIRYPYCQSQIQGINGSLRLFTVRNQRVSLGNVMMYPTRCIHGWWSVHPEHVYKAPIQSKAHPNHRPQLSVELIDHLLLRLTADATFPSRRTKFTQCARSSIQQDGGS